MGTPSHKGQKGGKQPLQTILLGLMSLIGLPASLFLSAGRWDWRAGWIYVSITLLGMIVSRILVVVKSTGLAAARVQSIPAGGIKPWDRWLMPYAAVFGPLLVFVTAGLDERLGWKPDPPPRLIYAGVLLMLLCIAFSTWAMLTNRFFAATVRIQTERGHHTVTGGPYRIVRHPGYLSGIIGFLTMPLILGSMWAFIPAIIGAGMLGLRTDLEDRTLQEELPGYREYTQKVKYRLIPRIW